MTLPPSSISGALSREYKETKVSPALKGGAFPPIMELNTQDNVIVGVIARLLLNNEGTNDKDAEFLAKAGRIRSDAALLELVEEGEHMLSMNKPIPEREELYEFMFEKFDDLPENEEALSLRHSAAH